MSRDNIAFALGVFCSEACANKLFFFGRNPFKASNYVAVCGDRGIVPPMAIWRPPDEGFFKGFVMASSAQRISVKLTPIIAKAMAVFCGVVFTIESGLVPFEVETDTLCVVNLVCAGKLNLSDLGMVIEDIYQRIRASLGSKVVYVPRKENMVAHTISKMSLHIDNDLFLMEDYPPCVERFFQEDFRGLSIVSRGRFSSEVHSGTCPFDSRSSFACSSWFLARTSSFFFSRLCSRVTFSVIWAARAMSRASISADSVIVVDLDHGAYPNRKIAKDRRWAPNCSRSNLNYFSIVEVGTNNLQNKGKRAMANHLRGFSLCGTFRRSS
ncbi:hypothetical protein Dsin_012483 [Dipteronia sinensis]|uniref:RNase H type-1 domain-containing protein n=1 Tax=Dipteronia sinensis TaxID=43782 RepID=A0AAE0E803_9ROSI|nr:hypothetical protein Dsin_012483 [Dipteronia sinensis]